MRSVLTITTPASAIALLTSEELRAAAGVSDSSQDTALGTLGDQASVAIARACGVASDGVNPPTLLEETCTETFRLGHDNRGATRLMLARRPVTSITSVTVDDEALTADEYEVDAASGALTRLCNDWPVHWYCGKVAVVYVAGFVAPPDDLKLAASKLVTALYVETARDANLKRVEIPDVITREYWVGPAGEPLITAEIAALLGPYKQRFI